ncbi:class A beta-lactamase [Rossellomorea marisflavi]|uniref:class A beta-lactamase n=1 Tax=Rossellomorea marisflavi TaxID=189381 RepID=UPI00203BF4D1|nr:class A beta-lactamase [Rossellomorea marisflavi]MCM2603361.1 class A beta-lactamase [Rossellomorea marisflavi]
MVLNKKILMVAMFTLLVLMTLTACMKPEKTPEPSSQKEAEESTDLDETFATIESDYDARVGVYAIDTGSDETIDYRSEERFAFASTYKALAAALVLKQNTMEELEEVITYTEDDLVSYSPITEKHVDTGMTLAELSEAAVRTSDNTAGNLLFEELGGPEQFQQSLREIGDDVTQSDRYETALNEFTPGNTRDTSTPAALATSLQGFAVGDLLTDDKRERLLDWMQGNATGDTLIRAGAPEGWTVADKSGAGRYGTRNDIAVVWPPDREPIILAIMTRHDTEDAEYDDALIAEVAEATLNALK